MSDEEEIGYSKPPRKSQFKKGTSGNPKGRPKGSKRKGPLEILNDQLRKKILVREEGQEKEMSVMEAFYKQLVARALKGERQAVKILHGDLEKVEKFSKENENKSITLKIVHGGYKGNYGKDEED